MVQADFGDYVELKKLNLPPDLEVINFLETIFKPFVTYPQKITFKLKMSFEKQLNLKHFFKIEDKNIKNNQLGFDLLESILHETQEQFYSTNNHLISIANDSHGKSSYYLNVLVFLWYLDISNKNIVPNKERIQFFKYIKKNAERRSDFGNQYIITCEIIKKTLSSWSTDHLILFFSLLWFQGFFDEFNRQSIKQVYYKFQIQKEYPGDFFLPINTKIEQEIKKYDLKFDKYISSEVIKEILMDEYHSLFVLRANGLWKDALVKMGSILEALLIFWYESQSFLKIERMIKKKLTMVSVRKVSFENLIEDFLNKLYPKVGDIIGRETEWKVVQNLIRPNRNNIHLTKYIKDVAQGKPTLNKSDYETLIKIFDSLIEKF